MERKNRIEEMGIAQVFMCSTRFFFYEGDETDSGGMGRQSLVTHS